MKNDSVLTTKIENMFCRPKLNNKNGHLYDIF